MRANSEYRLPSIVAAMLMGCIATVTFAEEVAPTAPLAVRVECSTPKVVIGRKVDLEIRLSNASQKTVLAYNPLLSRLLWGQCVTLAILSPDGAQIGDLMHWDGGSIKSTSRSDWVAIPPGGFVKSTFSFRAGAVRGTFFTGQNPLPPGKYTLQAWLHERAVTPPPIGTKGVGDDELEILGHLTYRDWMLDLPEEVIARSEKVEIELLPRTGD
jgi:hypothetical protein